MMTTRRLSSTLLSALLSLAVFAGIARGSDDGGVPRTNRIPPVLVHGESPDTAIVTLPGPAPEPPAKPAPVPATGSTAPNSMTGAEDGPRPFLRRAKRGYPIAFEQDSPVFLQQKIGQWKQFDVQELLDQPIRQRPAFDDEGKVSGVINAYADPTGRYREFELDFAGATGELRTVFVYPVKMTWQACRQLYGTSVTAAEATQGRKFYSYLNRRMDVLVDGAGRVVSLGFY